MAIGIVLTRRDDRVYRGGGLSEIERCRGTGTVVASLKHIDIDKFGRIEENILGFYSRITRQEKRLFAINEPCYN